MTVCALAQDFLQEQDFPGSNLIKADLKLERSKILSRKSWR
jgi:hypothetical protein